MIEYGSNGIAVDELRQYVERVERLSEERKALATDISDVLKEAASSGFDKAALKAVIRIRAQDTEKRSAHESLVDLYRTSLGI